MPTRVLFVCGFSTCQTGAPIPPTYEIFPKKYPDYTFDFFQYKNHENLKDVLVRLVKQINGTVKYTFIMAHSMGGFLVTTAMSQISKDLPIILLMPLIYDYNFIVKGLVSIDCTPDNFDDNLVKQIPLGLVAPKSSLVSTTWLEPDILVPGYGTLVPTIQILQSYYMLRYNFVNIVNAYASRPNLYFFYAKEEALNTLPSTQLQLLDSKIGKRLIVVQGKHEVFRDSNVSLRNLFFNALSGVLQYVQK